MSAQGMASLEDVAELRRIASRRREAVAQIIDALGPISPDALAAEASTCSLLERAAGTLERFLKGDYQ